MELNDFSAQILFGAKLADKLVQLENVEDSFIDKSIDKIKDLKPGRPKELAFLGSDRQSHPKNIPFPSLKNLEQERSRGIILHFFANHELLALELMALAILRFQDAPSAFRKGLVAIMQQEQKHLSFYIERMKQYGVEFGELAVNDFFWIHLAPMPTLIDFTNHLSLTFEQANLDFSLFYKNAFLKIGDKETAAVLDTVYQEEISHVEHGLYWQEKWLNTKPLTWQAYTENLRHPISPSRAKGSIFDEEGRARAGFDQKYIQHLKIHQQAKSRAVQLLIYNPDVEEEILYEGNNYSTSLVTQSLREDLSPLFAFLGHKEDVLLLPKIPSLSHQLYINDFGLDHSRYFLEESNKPSHLILDQLKKSGTRIELIKTWGYSRRIRQNFTQTELQCLPSFDSESHARLLNNKITAKKIWANFLDTQEKSKIFLDPKQHSCIVSNFKSIAQIVEQKSLLVGENWVLKLPFGASGRNFYKFRPSDLNSKNFKNWLNSQFGKCPELLLEPWYNRILDISVNFSCADSENFKISSRRFFVDNNGRYLGHFLNKRKQLLSLAQLDGSGFQDLLNDTFFIDLAKFFRTAYSQMNYHGPLGLDLYIYRSPYIESEQSLKQKYFLGFSEANPRHTMGKIASTLEKKIEKSSTGLFFIADRNHIQPNIFDLESSRTFLEPLTNGKNQRIKQALIWLNDPATLKQKTSGLIVIEDSTLYNEFIEKVFMEDLAKYYRI
ncbi:MAG: DUF455 family protein [Oligoflexales bacterium]|nr:DUF455 family protein [Oligoflexales bacterium]